MHLAVGVWTVKVQWHLSTSALAMQCKCERRRAGSASMAGVQPMRFALPDEVDQALPDKQLLEITKKRVSHQLPDINRKGRGGTETES